MTWCKYEVVGSFQGPLLSRERYFQNNWLKVYRSTGESLYGESIPKVTESNPIKLLSFGNPKVTLLITILDS
jgi:hypothetical protein